MRLRARQSHRAEIAGPHRMSVRPALYAVSRFRRPLRAPCSLSLVAVVAAERLVAAAAKARTRSSAPASRSRRRSASPASERAAPSAPERASAPSSEQAWAPSSEPASERARLFRSSLLRPSPSACSISSSRFFSSRFSWSLHLARRFLALGHRFLLGLFRLLRFRLSLLRHDRPPEWFSLKLSRCRRLPPSVSSALAGRAPLDLAR